MGVQDRDWYWKDSQGEDRSRRAAGGDRQRTPVHSGWSSHPITLILVVIFGISTAWAIGEAIVARQVRAALEQVTHSSQEAMRQSQAEVQRLQREAVALEAQRKADLQRQEAARTQAIVQRQQLEALLRRDIAEAAARKEKAWAKFYRRPPTCVEAATMECANEYIRAKRQFEERYARGEL